MFIRKIRGYREEGGQGGGGDAGGDNFAQPIFGAGADPNFNPDDTGDGTEGGGTEGGGTEGGGTEGGEEFKPTLPWDQFKEVKGFEIPEVLQTGKFEEGVTEQSLFQDAMKNAYTPNIDDSFVNRYYMASLYAKENDKDFNMGEFLQQEYTLMNAPNLEDDQFMLFNIGLEAGMKGEEMNEEALNAKLEEIKKADDYADQVKTAREAYTETLNKRNQKTQEAQEDVFKNLNTNETATVNQLKDTYKKDTEIFGGMKLSEEVLNKVWPDFEKSFLTTKELGYQPIMNDVAKPENQFLMYLMTHDKGETFKSMISDYKQAIKKEVLENSGLSPQEVEARLAKGGQSAPGALGTDDLK